MTVIIRKLDKTEHEYLAYAKSFCGKATYIVYFEDTIWGTVTLHNFIEMLRTYFQEKKVNVDIDNKNLTIKNELILDLIRE